ncbi:hypothetical protein [Streptomyces sp. FIT100]|uniref:hypothetical protein n=1 Tax=Streptomyces sp. FIT100 TaxID=2837956 RepID=UPI0021CA401C|nr:hypothetical protein [Streptomyces sp. FIT100]UUN25701.1 hypothetical protein KK483_04145 [Streptomyces sp. FIT100]
MANTRNQQQSMRRALRRDVPATVGLLVDEQDFTAMRRYRSFTFTDHPDYLHQVEKLLRTLSARSGHTTVAVFDPEDFAHYCTETGLDPDSSTSRSRYTAEIAASGATVAYTGQPLDHLVPLLVSRSVRQATWEYATAVLSGIGTCADCGEDIGRAAFDRAAQQLLSLIDTAGTGTHHLVCSIPAAGEQLLAVLHISTGQDTPAVLDSTEGAEFATVLAVGIALEGPGGVVLRTSAPETPDRLRGWRLHHGRLAPLTEGEVFSAYCTDAETGEPLSPEPGVEYRAGFDLGDPPDTPSHH